MTSEAVRTDCFHSKGLEAKKKKKYEAGVKELNLQKQFSKLKGTERGCEGIGRERVGKKRKEWMCEECTFIQMKISV